MKKTTTEEPEHRRLTPNQQLLLWPIMFFLVLVLAIAEQ